MQVVRDIVTGEELKTYPIPEELGERFEMILLPLGQAPGVGQETAMEHERFAASCYDAVINDDAEEDAIWNKYL